MENKIRFRNHISIVAERIGGLITFLIVIIITNMADNIADVFEYAGEGNLDLTWVLIGLGGSILLVLLIVGFQLLIWSKTYITLDDQSIVIETNTLTKKKNTIGLKHISNINIEQSLFERLIGTAKLKMDTNSMSTADQTDVKIVLKKADAEAVRKRIMLSMSAEEAAASAETAQEVSAQQDFPEDFSLSIQGMLQHGLYSIHLVSLVVVIGSIVGGVVAISDAVRGISVGNIIGLLQAVLVVAVIFFSAVWDIARNFVKYYGFKIGRTGNRLHLRYGLIKRVSYTIPVDKINALQLKQTAFGRLGRRYMAEIINIGMGDDKEEEQSFFLPYCTQSVLEANIEKLLPEFAGLMDRPRDKQTKATWLAWSLRILLYIFLMGAGSLTAIYYLGQYQQWILLGAGVFSLWMGVMVILQYFTESSTIDADYVIVTKGAMGRTICFISYPKIQYIEIKQNYLARLMKIQKGEVFLLASAKHRNQRMPYFSKEKTEFLRTAVITSRS